MAADHEPPYVFALGLLVYADPKLTHANEYLAAFGAGATLATVSPSLRESFHSFGELVAELVKLAALPVRRLVSPADGDGPVDRKVAVCGRRTARCGPCVHGARLAGQRPWSSRRSGGGLVWAKGFASVVYAMLVLHAPLEAGGHLFHLAALVVAASIAVHSSSDVPMVRWLSRASSTAKNELRRR
jgi:hypothetical protein